MRRKITKVQLLAYIQGLDTRAEDLSPAQLDEVMLTGFSEIATVVTPFSNEEVVNISEYVLNGETNITLDVEEDVLDIYDLYMDVSKQTDSRIQGIDIYRNTNVLFKDGRYVGRVHIALGELISSTRYIDNKYGITPGDINNIIIKYLYTPDADFEDAFIDSQAYLTLQFAMATSLYDYLHDVETASQKRAGMIRTGKAVMHSKPEDFRPEDTKPSMFPSGV